jgi:PAS domain S-box-containing protein
MLPPALTCLLRGLLVASCYYFAALLGISLAIPPGFATTLWPPSGIALGATLIWGRSILPGLFLGSFLINLGISSSGDDDKLALLISSGIATGSLLQAQLTAMAIRHWIGYPNALINDRDVFRFYGLAGPLGCLINASFSLGLLWLAGRVTLDTLPLNWLTWWLGDTIGVFIFTPILLAFFGKPRGAWRFRRRVLALPLIVSFCVTSLFFLYSRDFELRRQKTELQALSNTASDSVRHAVTSHLEELYTLQGLFHAAGSITREQFARFTVPAIARNPGIQGFSWNSWVKGGEREAFVLAQRQGGIAHFDITEKNQAGQFVKAREYADYVVVTYIEPFVSNGKALGYDIGSEPIRRAAIERAILSGALSSTAPIKLVQETGQQKGILVLLPVYRMPVTSGTEPHDAANMTGFVVEVLRIGDVIETALKELGDKRALLKIEVRDTDAPTGSDELYFDPVATTANALTLSTPLEVGGRHWVLVTTVTGELPGASLNTVYVLLGGVSFTALLGLLLMSLSGRTLGMEAEVRARTLELSQQNHRLLQEIHSREEAESALRESETRFRTMADSAPVLVFTSTANGQRDYFNRQWQHFTGQVSDSGERPDWQALFHPDDLTPYLALREEATRQEEPFTLSYRLRSASGDYRWFLDSSAPRFGIHHDFMGFISSCIDISDVKASQAALQMAKDAAEQANTVKSEFMANLSHELLTPMNAILGLSHLLLDENLSPEARSPLEKINLSAQNLLVLLNTLLDFSALESGQMKITACEFSLGETLGKLVEQTTLAAQAKGLTLVFNADPRIPDHLIGDSSRLTQVLANLLSNAVKFTEQGRVTLTTELKEQARDASLWITLKVSDTGIGISPEQQHALFSAFSQADGSSTRKYGGTGLGLTVAERLTRNMGGEIRVESTPGQGSTFSLSLPFQARAAESTHVSPSENARDFHNLRVLVVEDNSLNQLVAKRFLARLEITADLAENGQAALEKVATADVPYDAILMDVQMPVMDGLEATRRLREQYSQTRLPIIAVSANTSDQDRRNCLAAGMNDFIPKPLDLAGLTRILGFWLPAQGHGL